MQRLRCLVWKEFLELRQNPRLFGLVIVAPIIQLTMLGYAATTDVKDVPVVVADGDRIAGQPRADRALRRVAQLHGHRHGDDRQRDRAVPRARRRVAGAVDPAGLRRRSLGRRPVTRAGRRRRHRLELDDRRARLRDEPGRRLRAGARRPTRPPPARPASTGDRRPHPRLVQPAAREPLLHDPRRAGAASCSSSPPTWRRWPSSARRSSARSSS